LNVNYHIPEEEEGAIRGEYGILFVKAVAELFKLRLFLELHNVRWVVEFMQFLFGGVGETFVDISDLGLLRAVAAVDERDHELALLNGIGQLFHLVLIFI
jgi:hypothetical protein